MPRVLVSNTRVFVPEFYASLFVCVLLPETTFVSCRVGRNSLILRKRGTLFGSDRELVQALTRRHPTKESQLDPRPVHVGFEVAVWQEKWVLEVKDEKRKSERKKEKRKMRIEKKGREMMKRKQGRCTDGEGQHRSAENPKCLWLYECSGR